MRISKFSENLTFYPIAHEYITENLLEVYRETLTLSDKLLETIFQAEQFIQNLKAGG